MSLQEDYIVKLIYHENRAESDVRINKFESHLMARFGQMQAKAKGIIISPTIGNIAEAEKATKSLGQTSVVAGANIAAVTTATTKQAAVQSEAAQTAERLRKGITSQVQQNARLANSMNAINASGQITGHEYKKNTKIASAYTKSTQNLGKQIQTLGRSGQVSSKEFQRLSSAFDKAEKGSIRNTKTMNTLSNTLRKNKVRIDQFNGSMTTMTKLSKDPAHKILGNNFAASGASLGSLVAKISAFVLVTGGVIAMFMAFRSLKDSVSDVDKAVFDLKKVLRGTNDENERALKLMKAQSKALNQLVGVNMEAALAANRDFIQQGRSVADAMDLTTVAMIATNIAELEVADATRFLTAATAQFGIEGKNAIGILDAWNNLSNKVGGSTFEIAEAVTRAGGAFKAAGGTIHELSALSTTLIRTTGQAGSMIGRTMRFMSVRMLDTNKVTRIANILTEKTKEKTEDLEGQMTSLYKVLTILQGRWSNLTKEQRFNIQQTLAGTKHASRFLTLVRNMDLAHKALIVSLDSAGSAIIENAVKMESLNSKTERLIASFRSLSVQAGDAGLLGVFKKFIDGLNTVILGMGKMTTAGLVLAGVIGGALTVAVITFTGAWGAVIPLIAAHPFVALGVAILAIIPMLGAAAQQMDLFGIKTAAADTMVKSEIANLEALHRNHGQLIDIIQSENTLQTTRIAAEQTLIKALGDEGKAILNMIKTGKSRGAIEIAIIEAILNAENKLLNVRRNNQIELAKELFTKQRGRLFDPSGEPTTKLQKAVAKLDVAGVTVESLKPLQEAIILGNEKAARLIVDDLKKAPGLAAGTEKIDIIDVTLYKSALDQMANSVKGIPDEIKPVKIEFDKTFGDKSLTTLNEFSGAIGGTARTFKRLSQPLKDFNAQINVLNTEILQSQISFANVNKEYDGSSKNIQQLTKMEDLLQSKLSAVNFELSKTEAIIDGYDKKGIQAASTTEFLSQKLFVEKTRLNNINKSLNDNQIAYKTLTKDKKTMTQEDINAANVIQEKIKELNREKITQEDVVLRVQNQTSAYKTLKAESDSTLQSILSNTTELNTKTKELENTIRNTYQQTIVEGLTGQLGSASAVFDTMVQRVGVNIQEHLAKKTAEGMTEGMENSIKFIGDVFKDLKIELPFKKEIDDLLGSDFSKGIGEFGTQIFEGAQTGAGFGALAGFIGIGGQSRQAKEQASSLGTAGGAIGAIFGPGGAVAGSIIGGVLGGILGGEEHEKAAQRQRVELKAIEASQDSIAEKMRKINNLEDIGANEREEAISRLRAAQVAYNNDIENYRFAVQMGGAAMDEISEKVAGLNLLIEEGKRQGEDVSGFEREKQMLLRPGGRIREGETKLELRLLELTSESKKNAERLKFYNEQLREFGDQLGIQELLRLKQQIIKLEQTVNIDAQIRSDEDLERLTERIVGKISVFEAARNNTFNFGA